MHYIFLLKQMRLEKRGGGGIDTDPDGEICDISNLDRLGSSEVEQVQHVIDGVHALIALEKRLQDGERIDILDPDVIVLGGGLSNIDFLYSEGKNSVYEKVFSDLVQTPILKNKLGDSAGVFGAALLN